MAKSGLILSLILGLFAAVGRAQEQHFSFSFTGKVGVINTDTKDDFVSVTDEAYNSKLRGSAKPRQMQSGLNTEPKEQRELKHIKVDGKENKIKIGSPKHCRECYQAGCHDRDYIFKPLNNICADLLCDSLTCPPPKCDKCRRKSCYTDGIETSLTRKDSSRCSRWGCYTAECVNDQCKRCQEAGCIGGQSGSDKSYCKKWGCGQVTCIAPPPKDRKGEVPVPPNKPSNGHL